MHVLRQDRVVDAASIDVTADQGVVILTGMLAAIVRQALQWDAFVDARNIGVSAKRDIVSLRGSVVGAAQKRRAIDLSWAAGARQVVADGLQVVPGPLRVGADTRVLRDSSSDQVLTAAVRRALQFDLRLTDWTIDISASAGVVKLEGMVPSLAAKRAAEWMVRGVRGVEAIQNHLQVPESNDDGMPYRVWSAVMGDAVPPFTPHLGPFRIAFAEHAQIYGARTH